MDFSYFTPHQPYQLFNLPPTPAASNTPQPEDYRAVVSPVRMSGDASAYVPTSDPDTQQEQFDTAFAAFQQNFRYDPSTFFPHQSQSLSHSPPNPLRKDSDLSTSELDGTGLHSFAADMAQDEQMRRSSSEEKESLTPAQSRRKAQNRAA